MKAVSCRICGMGHPIGYRRCTVNWKSNLIEAKASLSKVAASRPDFETSTLATIRRQTEEEAVKCPRCDWWIRQNGICNSCRHIGYSRRPLSSEETKFLGTAVEQFETFVHCGSYELAGRHLIDVLTMPHLLDEPDEAALQLEPLATQAVRAKYRLLGDQPLERAWSDSVDINARGSWGDDRLLQSIVYGLVLADNRHDYPPYPHSVLNTFYGKIVRTQQASLECAQKESAQRVEELRKLATRQTVDVEGMIRNLLELGLPADQIAKQVADALARVSVTPPDDGGPLTPHSF